MQALAALVEYGIVTRQDGETLRKAYLFIRMLIDGLRMVRGNAKDLVLPPVDSDEFIFLARRVGYTTDDWQAGARHLQTDIEEHMAKVKELRGRLASCNGDSLLVYRMSVMACYIGLSGYYYKAWQGHNRFYPSDIKPTAFLRYYATRYQTVELDGVGIDFPSEKTVQTWLTDTPPHFIYAPKAHREITHIRRLRPEGLPIVMAMLQRLEPLHTAGKLGPILIQLPPNLKRDDGRLETFLGSLPTTYQWAVNTVH